MVLSVYWTAARPMGAIILETPMDSIDEYARRIAACLKQRRETLAVA